MITFIAEKKSRVVSLLPYGATAAKKLLSMHSRASPRVLISDTQTLSSSFIQNLSKSIARSVEVSRALNSRRSANACSSVLTLLLSRCASLASLTEVCVTSEPKFSSLAFSSSTKPGIRLRVAILMAAVISVFFSKAATTTKGSHNKHKVSEINLRTRAVILLQLLFRFHLTHLPKLRFSSC